MVHCSQVIATRYPHKNWRVEMIEEDDHVAHGSAELQDTSTKTPLSAAPTPFYSTHFAATEPIYDGDCYTVNCEGCVPALGVSASPVPLSFEVNLSPVNVGNPLPALKTDIPVAEPLKMDLDDMKTRIEKSVNPLLYRKHV